MRTAQSSIEANTKWINNSKQRNVSIDVACHEPYCLYCITLFILGFQKRLNTTPPAIRERRRSKDRESVAVASVAAFGANNLHRRLKRLNSVSKEIAS